MHWFNFFSKTLLSYSLISKFTLISIKLIFFLCFWSFIPLHKNNTFVIRYYENLYILKLFPLPPLPLRLIIWLHLIMCHLGVTTRGRTKSFEFRFSSISQNLWIFMKNFARNSKLNFEQMCQQHGSEKPFKYSCWSITQNLSIFVKNFAKEFFCSKLNFEKM